MNILCLCTAERLLRIRFLVVLTEPVRSMRGRARSVDRFRQKDKVWRY
jgi:hypothetical protein